MERNSTENQFIVRQFSVDEDMPRFIHLHCYLIAYHLDIEE